MDILHTISYKGINVLDGHHTNLSTQFLDPGDVCWRQPVGPATMVFLQRRHAPRWPHVVLYLAMALGMMSILWWRNFPICFP